MRRLLTILLALSSSSALKLPAVYSSHTSTASLTTSRRSLLLAAPLSAAALLGQPLSVSAADPKEVALLEELKAIRTAILPLQALLDEQKWDSVRSVLKTSPVANMWNLGESKNAVRKLAELRDDVELFEMAEEISSALQLADQYTYDNNFIYYQPGNGKVKIKEPKQQLKIAAEKLQEVLESS